MLLVQKLISIRVCVTCNMSLRPSVRICLPNSLTQRFKIPQWNFHFHWSMMEDAQLQFQLQVAAFHRVFVTAVCPSPLRQCSARHGQHSAARVWTEPPMISLYMLLLLLRSSSKFAIVVKLAVHQVYLMWFQRLFTCRATIIRHAEWWN